MIIKQIICQVKPGQRETFFEEQKRWKALSGSNGFAGQIGGWNKYDPMTACIFSFWESEEAYCFFMNEIHDKVLLNSRQSSSYSSINVSLYKIFMHIPGTSSNYLDILKSSQYIRAVLPQAKEQDSSHFVNMQKELWYPQLMKAIGMQGGIVASSLKDKNDLLVITLWNHEMHKPSVKEFFEASPGSNKLKLAGIEFKVEEAWRV
jgi:heme-degrading monooxygenase HmoA